MAYVEPANDLSEDARDMHRALESLKEELDATDWYNQRINLCKDAELKSHLAHNAKEEKEHASMLLEWIRRKNPEFEHEMHDWIGSNKAFHD